MTVDEITEKILNQQAEIDTIKAQLLKQHDVIQSEVSKRLASSYKICVDEYVRKFSSITKALVPEGLKGLKQDLDQSISSVTTNTDKYFTEKTAEIYAYESKEFNSIDDIYATQTYMDDRIRRGVNDAVENIFNNISVVLDKYGYKEPLKSWDHTNHYTYWFPYDQRNINHAVTTYIGLVHKYFNALGNMLRLEKQKDEQEAFDLWDSVQ